MNISTPQGAITDFGSLGAGILTLVILVAGLITFLYIMLGGMKLITAGGDKERAKSAVRQIIHAIVGLFIVLAAWGVMMYIQSATGACFGLACSLDLLEIFNRL
jgi:hypothetical protein